MAGHDEHDLERALREQRPEAGEQFVQTLAATVRDRRATSPRSRRRLTLSLALSLALLVSLVAFGGVGAAKSALHSSTAAVRSAVGEKPKTQGNDNTYNHNNAPSTKQYHEKVYICYPIIRYVVTYKWITEYKWVWKWQTKSGHRHHYLVKVPVLVKVRVRTRVLSYSSRLVSAARVPALVAKGAVYPVPSGGCASVSTGATT